MNTRKKNKRYPKIYNDSLQRSLQYPKVQRSNKITEMDEEDKKEVL